MEKLTKSAEAHIRHLLTDEDFAQVVLKYYIEKEKVIKHLEALLEYGHGGGNWRRLVIQLIGEYQKEEAMKKIKQ